MDHHEFHLFLVLLVCGFAEHSWWFKGHRRSKEEDKQVEPSEREKRTCSIIALQSHYP